MIDLQQFCSKDELRPVLMNPYSDGAVTIATSGHIIVQVRRRLDVPENKKAPSAERCAKLLAVPEGSAFRRFEPPNLPPPDPNAPCETCEGRGSTHDCPSCNCTCVACDGTGLDTPQTSVSIDGEPFNAAYIKQIQALSDCEIASLYKEGHPRPFRFAEGIGAIMPLRTTFSNHLGDLKEAEAVACSPPAAEEPAA